jgi:RNA polymerase sigma factor (sigma-70 family)
MTTRQVAQAEFALDVDTLRVEYFGSQQRLPTDIISRKIWMTIIRYRSGNAISGEQDIHQSAYVMLLTNFAKIVTKFAESGREPTKSNFEAWLTICIRHLVVDTMRRLPSHERSLEEFGEIEWPAPPSDPVRQMRMHLLFSAACDGLTPIERDVIEKRLADGDKPAALAALYGLKVAQIYKLLYQAKLKLRNEMVRTIVEDKLDQKPELRARYKALVEHRCTLKHQCYFYRDPCPLASPAAGLVAAHGGFSDGDLGDREREATDLVRDLLDEWNLPPILDRCYWAATDGGSKTAPTSVYSMTVGGPAVQEAE